MRVSKPNNAAVCIMSNALPSAKPSLISNKTNSSHKAARAILSAQVAPTAPAPTTVTFIKKIFINKEIIFSSAKVIEEPEAC